MKWKIALIIVGVILFTSWMMQQIQSQSATPTEGRKATIQVATTIFPFGSIAEQVGAGYADVSVMVPPGASPHTFEPSPQDIVAIQSADIVFVVGLGFDDWMLEYVPETAQVIDLSTEIDVIDAAGNRLSDAEAAELRAESEDHDHEHDHGAIDPHYWLSPINAQVIAGEIRDAYLAADEGHGLAFTNAYYAFTGELDAVLQEYNPVYEKMKGAKIVTTHDAFGYLAHNLAAEVVATINPTGSEVGSAQQNEEVVNTIVENEISIVFTEPQQSNQVAEQLAAEYDVRLVELDPLGGVEGRDSYIELLKYNLDNLSQLSE